MTIRPGPLAGEVARHLAPLGRAFTPNFPEEPRPYLKKGVAMKIWTDKALSVVKQAEGKAYAMNHAHLDPLHLLWAFLSGGPQAEKTAKALDLEPELVALAAEQELGRMPQERNFDVSTPNDAFRSLFLRAADLAVTSPVIRQGGRIGRRELLLALTEDSGRAGALVRNFETAGGPA